MNINIIIIIIIIIIYIIIIFIIFIVVFYLLTRCGRNKLLESFRFWDKDDCEYEIFSLLSIAHA